MDELQIRLTEDEIKTFQAISQSATGKVLFSYLARVKQELFNPKALTVENFQARKEAYHLIEEYIEKKIKLPLNDKPSEPNQYV